MSQANVEVPPAAAPVAASAAQPVAAPPAAAAPPATVQTPAAAAPSAQPASTATPPAEEPNWFKPRVEQAKRSGANEVLTKLGVKDADEAKALIDKAKAAEDAAKSELQRAKEEAASFKAKASRADELEIAVKAQADSELAALTEAQRATVADVIGDDPATILKKLPKLKASWVVAAPAAVAATAAQAAPAAAPAVQPAPATTTPPPTAPGGSPNTSPPDHKAIYKQLKEKNPHAAATYLNSNLNEIYPRS